MLHLIIVNNVLAYAFAMLVVLHVGLNIFYFTIFYITKVHTCKHYQNKRIGTKAKKCLYSSSPSRL